MAYFILPRMKTRRPDWIIIMLVILAVIVDKVTPTFNCRRHSITCANSGTCGSDGQCHSCPGYQGYDCQLPLAYIGKNDCVGSNHCRNAAICYDDTDDNDITKVKCHCLPQHTGDRCSQARFTVTCTNIQMDISIIPYSATAAVYGKDKKGSCDLTEASGVWTRTSILHSTDSACGSADITLSPTTFARQFIVQDFNNRLSDADFVVTAVCSQDISIGTVSTSPFDVTPYIGELEVQLESGDVTLSSVDPVGSVRQIGDLVTLTFTGNDGLEEILLDSIVASDNQDGGSTETLISAGCRTTGKEAIVATNPAHPEADKTIVEVKLRLFLFNSGPSLKLTFTFKTCLTGNTVDCAAMSCSRKRKRDVASSAASNNTKSVIDVVFTTKEAVRSNTESSDENRHCEDCDDVILPVVTGGAACFVGLLVLGLVLVAVKRWRHKYSKDSHIARDSERHVIQIAQ
ncbi:uncharacterized protein LOC121385355 isoform X2 [Gigantopelta aegis]|nr:uncharacterized protein LOC121385355 isoform X2 [Gigantopelta aegis]